MPKACIDKSSMVSLLITAMREARTDALFNANALNQFVRRNLRKLPSNNKSCPSNCSLIHERTDGFDKVQILVMVPPSGVADVELDPGSLLPASWNLEVQTVVRTEERIETAQERRKRLSEAVRETTEGLTRPSQVMTEVKKIMVLSDTKHLDDRWFDCLCPFQRRSCC